jgi:hypothetical protein
VDESNATIQLAEVQYRPLTLALGEAYAVLSDAINHPAPQQPSPEPKDGLDEPEEAPRSRGRKRSDGSAAQPRTALQKSVVEIWDEDEETWKRKGRGRVPAGAKTRRVDPDTGDVVAE